MPDIIVRYSSVDRFRQTRRFKTMPGAQKYAQKMVGATPEISVTFGYAVSGSGVGKVTCDGCTLLDLFPVLKAREAADLGPLPERSLEQYAQDRADSLGEPYVPEWAATEDD